MAKDYQYEWTINMSGETEQKWRLKETAIFH